MCIFAFGNQYTTYVPIEISTVESPKTVLGVRCLQLLGKLCWVKTLPPPHRISGHDSISWELCSNKNTHNNGEPCVIDRVMGK